MHACFSLAKLESVRYRVFYFLFFIFVCVYNINKQETSFATKFLYVFFMLNQIVLIFNDLPIDYMELLFLNCVKYSHSYRYLQIRSVFFGTPLWFKRNFIFCWVKILVSIQFSVPLMKRSLQNGVFFNNTGMPHIKWRTNEILLS